MKFIDKDALAVEIEKRIKNLYPKGSQGIVVTKILKDHYEDLLSFINTLEVKGVKDSTDVFIEKTCKFLKSYRQDTPDGTGYIAGIVNDKTIEDFRNYMEGE